jgi:hypothetical protein
MIRRGASSGFRGIEERWRREHSDVLRSYSGQWIVLEGERVVAHGLDPVEVINAAKSKGIAIPYVFLVERKEPDVVHLGL